MLPVGWPCYTHIRAHATIPPTKTHIPVIECSVEWAGTGQIQHRWWAHHFSFSLFFFLFASLRLHRLSEMRTRVRSWWRMLSGVWGLLWVLLCEVRRARCRPFISEVLECQLPRGLVHITVRAKAGGCFMRKGSHLRPNKARSECHLLCMEVFAATCKTPLYHMIMGYNMIVFLPYHHKSSNSQNTFCLCSILDSGQNQRARVMNSQQEQHQGDLRLWINA